jgi:hypothetical protein
MFSMTSMGAKIDNEVNEGCGPYIYRINGENYRRLGSLMPIDGQQHILFSCIFMILQMKFKIEFKQ